eukprot:TRINITY_DN32051_c0_g1_i1.p1 TRINITY_DN32051_c0_g1~~TRINITY_DN32051_c0_g1_i1.p1  ORF type:complete len:756 (+),score=271.97 TRINITY_DN32051_c0_g1_i1:64-2331(+)
MVSLRHKSPSMSNRAQAATAEMVRRSAGGGQRLTLDTLLHHIAENPGSVAGSAGPTDYNTLKRMWVSMCAQLSSQMAAAKGTNIPTFGVVSLQRFANDRGTWGEKVDLIPTFTLHPTFTASFGTTTEQTKRAANVSSVVTAPLNLAVLAMKSGVSKATCSDMLKDIFRKVGEVAKMGANFCVDLGVCRVTFRHNQAKAMWNDQFASYLGRLTSTYNSGTTQEPDGRWGEAAIQKSITLGKEDEQAAYIDEIERNTPQIPDADPAPGGPCDSEVTSAAQTPSHVHKVRPMSAGATRRLPESDAADVVSRSVLPPHARRPMSASATRRTKREEEAAMLPDRRAVPLSYAADAAADAAAPSAATSLSKNMLLQNDAKDMSQLRSHLYDAISQARAQEESRTPSLSNYSAMMNAPPMRNEKYQNRLRNKRKFKRMRNKAYSDAWEEQQRQKREQVRMEREKDRRLLEITRMREAKEQLATEQAEDSRRKVARHVQDENKRLTNRKQRHDGKIAAQCDYWGTEEAPPPKPTLAEVREEIAEHKARKARDKEEEALEETRLLERQQQLWDMEQTAERKKRLDEKVAMLEEYEKSKRLRGNRKLPGSTAHQPTHTISVNESEGDFGGNYFFKGRTIEGLLNDERAERDERRNAALKVQQANQRTVADHDSQRRAQRGMLATAERRNHDRAIFRALQLDSEEESGRRAQRHALKDAWDQQVKARSAARREERDDRLKASTLHAWRNESSDEEYDDFHSTRKHC